MKILFTLIAIALCDNILWTGALWFGPRAFPPVPMFAVPMSISIAALLLGLFTLPFAILSRQARLLRPVFLVCMAIQAAADQNRLQPWFYEYVILLAFLWRLPSEDGESTCERGYLILRIVVATIYFWSGLQKANFSYLTEGVSWFAEPLFTISHTLGLVAAFLFVLAPIFEVLTGILLFSRWHRHAAVAAIAMHAAIFMLLGPWGRGWNSAVWPWNIAMIVFNVLLILNPQPLPRFREIFGGLGRSLRAGIVAFTLLPALSFFDFWDMYLSFALYSWNTRDAQFSVEPQDANLLPPSAASSLLVKDKRIALQIPQWSIVDVNVPCIPEKRLFFGVADSLCQQTQGKGTLTIFERPNLLTGARNKMKYACGEW